MNLLYLFSLVLLVACSTGSSRPEENERVPYPEKYVQDGYLETADSLRPKFKPDTSVGPVCLLNSANVDEFLGSNAMERLKEGDDGLPQASVLSKDEQQKLTFFFHPGGVKKKFSEFRVEYTSPPDRNTKTTNEAAFRTESGIHLGMTIGELKAIKGETEELKSSTTTTLRYVIDDIKTSEFLQRYNMPLYYAGYTFLNRYLIEFRFGFEYP